MDIKFQNILEADKNLNELVRKWRNSKQVNQYMYTNHYISKKEHQKWFEKLRENDSGIAWIIIYNNKPVGVAQLSNIDYKKKETEWGFYIADKSVKGKGVGSASLIKLIEYVFEKMNFNKMKTIVLENNTIAIKLYKKFGFKTEGKLKEKLQRDGKQIEVFLISLSKNEWEKVKTDINP